MPADRLKRAADLALSGITLLAALPLLAGVWAVVWLDSPGPAIFSQERVGRHGRRFLLHKFRTMRHRDPDAIDHVAEGPLGGGADPRVTRVGRVLRKTSLDELPQLWNVIRGDMSIVGPRPVLPAQLGAIPSEAMARFDVRPGVTGLAQVRGRQSVPWPAKLRYDVEYVRTRGLWLDLRILFETVRVIVSVKGTYYEAPGTDWRAFLETPGSGRPEDPDV
jgi:lipopolysaccharide/colanic/teichoic acid biosynthesis glycosyltransferase